MLTSCSDFEALFESEPEMDRKSKDEGHGRITINVGGLRHETYLTTLRNHPDTRLYWISEQHHTSTRSPQYNPEKKEYFFDRHPGVFAHIVNYYRTGKLHCPMDVCGPLFEEELSFWGIDERQVELCCWENYKQHKDKQEKLNYFTTPSDGDDQEEDEDLDYSFWKNVKRQGYMLFEKPASSTPAKLVSILNLITFLITIIQFCLTTLKSFQKDSQKMKILSNVRVFTVSWFLLDLVLRLIFAPSLVEHFKKLLHWLDITSVCALIVHMKIHQSPNAIQPFEMLIFLKSIRLFNLLTFSFVIQVLTNTLKASTRELGLLTIVVVFQAFVFSMLLFFIERGESITEFESVPHSLWWAIITMTTVGYGDIQPQTWIGKVLGCCCAMCGVLVIALPVSVVGTNFSLFYTYAKARLNLPPKVEQKPPLSKELTSLKAKKAELPHTTSSYSCNSIAKKYEQAKESLERLTENQGDDKTDATSISERQLNGSKPKQLQNLSDSDHDDLTPSFRECNFDFLEVPVGKRLKKSFLSNSISRVIGAITHHPRQSQSPPSALQFDAQSTYPLYLRRGAVAPGSISSRSFSSTIYDSGSSNIPSCVKQSVRSLRRKQTLIKRLGNKRKCTSNAELHLVCFHRCDKHPDNNNKSTDNCSCPTQQLSKPRLAKSCSELNDILQGNYQNSLNSMASENISSGDIMINDRPQSVPLSEIAITINGCSDEGSETKEQNVPLIRINDPGNKGTFLKPWAHNHQGR
ncbi:potassium voltage-gated channel subfamily C member 1-like isoform X2 [Dendronephthya gigantea]|uniref:potassium voltage-gated channel subfamily C member 1-like isoform X2 n=1 Tax=Dendronephthya gigantea TaxID=151771 RepID=UPI0010692183|nr:potassium voltage-gated channel subfamily C member 1-like isoform X2 [Dendronephthya gigantea]